MKIKSFEFNLRELAGSMGDFGTLFPLAIGYIVVCGLNPSGFLFMMGLANIVTGLVYRLPMPIEPMKVLAVMAIAQKWSPSMVYASGFTMGVVWLFLSVTGLITLVAKITPSSVTRGIQISLGLLLAIQAAKMILTWWWLGIAAILIVVVLRKNRYAPAAIVLIVVGIGVMLLNRQFPLIEGPSFSIPPLTIFSINELWPTFLRAGLAQIPLTATNAVIATSALIKSYWPEREVTVKQLSLNMGIMNLILPFFGGMPLCHGAGGLAGQYYFGARTGGTNIIEGVIEVSLGLFLAYSIADLFSFFPTAIIGAMMFLVGIELTKFAQDLKLNKGLFALGATVVVSMITNMAYGFVSGVIVHYIIRYFSKGKRA